MIALDTETTGLDLYHGARPFFVTICDEQGNNTWWEWDVDPLTRKVKADRSDLLELRRTIYAADGLVLQNAKFDVGMLTLLFRDHRLGLKWPWSLTHDTLIAGHLLASNQPHDLTSMALIYLGLNIKPYEDALEEAIKRAQQTARRRYKDWRLAKKDLPEMPSAKEKTWQFDAWLPRQLAELRKGPVTWKTTLRDYSNADSTTTWYLFQEMRKRIKQLGLWRVYLERLKVLPVAWGMEQRGVTVNRQRTEQLITEYAEESRRAGDVCQAVATAHKYKLTLPKSGNNKSLSTFMLGPLGLVSNKKSKKTGAPSLDRSVLDHWLATLPPDSEQLRFVEALQAKRKRDTATNYMESYKRFWVPAGIFNNKGEQLWYCLHPSLNPTGTDTLRWSSSNPNEQNISKKEGFNLRYCFGPAPGREWWSLDAANIELRLPAYEAGETEMIELFERPDDPPYYGSYHLLIFDTLHPDKFAKHGKKCKDVYASTWYQWTKNGNFAVQYGAIESSGTADRAYHVPGAQRRIQQRFAKIAKLNQRMIDVAQRQGYVETIPDKTVDPRRGYPLYCTRTSYNRVLPTVPLNYHIQGTAMWWMMKAMIRCQAQLDAWEGFDGYIALQVHDELVFDLHVGHNRPRVTRLQKLMQQGGTDLGIPTPVSIKHHPKTWSEDD